MLPSVLTWKRRPNVESLADLLKSPPQKMIAAQGFMDIPVKDGKIRACPLLANIPVLLDDGLDTVVGHAWGHRYVVSGDDVLHAYDILLSDEYQERYGSRRNQHFDMVKMVLDEDRPNTIQCLIAIRCEVKHVLSRYLPTEVTGIDPFTDFDSVIARHSARGTAIRNYHSWFRFFVENKEVLFN